MKHTFRTEDEAIDELIANSWHETSDEGVYESARVEDEQRTIEKSSYGWTIHEWRRVATYIVE
jgi:hypothetical protein